MTRGYGWGKGGDRVVDTTPGGHWHSTTMLAAIRYDGVIGEACLAFPGAIDGAMFLMCIEKMLAPTLREAVVVGELQKRPRPAVADGVDLGQHAVDRLGLVAVRQQDRARAELTPQRAPARGLHGDAVVAPVAAWALIALATFTNIAREFDLFPIATQRKLMTQVGIALATVEQAETGR